MKKLELEQYGVQEMDVGEIKVINGGISPYQNGTMVDEACYQDGDAVVSFFEGVVHALLN